MEILRELKVDPGVIEREAGRAVHAIGIPTCEDAHPRSEKHQRDQEGGRLRAGDSALHGGRMPTRFPS